MMHDNYNNQNQKTTDPKGKTPGFTLNKFPELRADEFMLVLIAESNTVSLVK